MPWYLTATAERCGFKAEPNKWRPKLYEGIVSLLAVSDLDTDRLKLMPPPDHIERCVVKETVGS